MCLRRTGSSPVARILQFNIIGVDSKEVPPVPIPNTEVKLFSVEDTWLVTAWEVRTMPIYASLAQSVEHAAVNRRVVGSSPTGGAKEKPFLKERFFLWHFF